MRRNTRWPLVALGVVAVSVSAQAGVITIGGTALVNPDHFEDFGTNPTPVTGVTTQFASNGLNIVTVSGAGIQLTTNAFCPNIGQGVDGGYLYIGLNGPCNWSPATDAVSIQFDTYVSELSWTGFSRASESGFNVFALRDGAIVSFTVFTQSNSFENRVVTFTGDTFNEIRLVERSGDGRYFALDNLSWNTVSVPEPSSLALLGLGLAGIGFARRRKTR